MVEADIVEFIDKVVVCVGWIMWVDCFLLGGVLKVYRWVKGFHFWRFVVRLVFCDGVFSSP